MPAIPEDHQAQPELPPNTFRVLVTGFGAFSHYEENPSWLAVKPLQNAILTTDVQSDKTAAAGGRRAIHITTLQIPVVYESVLETVPGLHARPPILPESALPDTLPPPHTSYDFMFHIGVAGRGPLRMERVGHKLGYHMKDASGKLASVTRSSPKDFSRRDMHEVTAAENAERERLGMDIVETGGDSIARPTRGFGSAYETFSDEITTDIDVTRLVQDLRRSGVEQIYTSMDAGHYLCDFIYYCSLAEAKRTSNPYEKRRNTQVLFLHCPPVNQPLSTEEVTDAIKRIIIWVCGEQQLDDDREEASGGAGN
ncbi:hypothetical protein B0H34DRAFT_696675 [Crassisporium funariophilum]|nr:hypothetical protein B0H34DRAFT_696675 [Crassisporium funariophilum]